MGGPAAEYGGGPDRRNRARVSPVRARGRHKDRELPSSTIYDTEYLLSTALEGLPEYLAGELPILKRRELGLLDARPGDRVLDLGCGRGEATAELLQRDTRPVAVDYSWDAVALTHKLVGDRALVVQADATALPFAPGAFERVLMADIIEHLPRPLGLVAMGEVDRVMTPGGRALVHTAPNTWFIAVVKRPIELIARILGRKEITDRFHAYDRLRDAMHPNEMSPLTFPRLMRDAGVQAKTWVDRDVVRSGESAWTQHFKDRRLFKVVSAVAGSWPLRLVLGNDMYAVVDASGRQGSLRPESVA
jgi:ubiquinone/menaquinone biosynthesis C-methylase UbiE